MDPTEAELQAIQTLAHALAGAAVADDLEATLREDQTD